MKIKKFIEILILILVCIGASYLLYDSIKETILHVKIASSKKEESVNKDSENNVVNHITFSDPIVIFSDTNKLTELEKTKLKEKISNWICETYPKVYKRLANEISNHLVEHSKIPLVMLGLIGAESSYRIQLRNSVNAIGLCQVRYFIWKKEAPEKFKEFGITSLSELYDPIKNIKIGEYILLKYLEDTGNIFDALVKYHTGKSKITQLSSMQQIKTKKYINDVLLNCGKAYIALSLVTTRESKSIQKNQTNNKKQNDKNKKN